MNETELDALLDSWDAPAPPPSLRRGLVAALPAPRRGVFGVPLRWVLAVAGVALCAALGAGTFDSSQLAHSYERWDGPGGSLYVISTRVIVPPASPFKQWSLGYGSSFGTKGGVPHGASYLYDHSGSKYAGFEYTLEQLASGQFRVSLSPMSLSSLRMRLGPFKMNGPLSAPPGLPASQTVQAGEPFEVTLWESGGERIYERIVLSWTPPADWPGVSHQTTQDGSMRLAGPQLYVDGQLVASQRSAGFGPVIWVHLPGQGRFLVALDPQGNSRFAQAGHVNGNAIEFQSGGAQFRITCTEPITAGGDHPVFVYHQQSFENLLDPAHPLTQQPFMGNAGMASLHQE
jgi:hypothetical protein